MPDYEDLLHNHATHAAQALPPIIEETAACLGIASDSEKIELLGEGLARAYMAGADAGQSEVLAQAVEQGAQLDVEQLRPPDQASSEEPGGTD